MDRVRICFLVVGIAASAAGCDSRTVPTPANPVSTKASPTIPALKKKSKPQKRITDPAKLAPLSSKTFQPDI
jgi:hypothetical protein